MNTPNTGMTERLAVVYKILLQKVLRPDTPDEGSINVCYYGDDIFIIPDDNFHTLNCPIRTDWPEIACPRGLLN